MLRLHDFLFFVIHIFTCIAGSCQQYDNINSSQSVVRNITKSFILQYDETEIRLLMGFDSRKCMHQVRIGFLQIMILSFFGLYAVRNTLQTKNNRTGLRYFLVILLSYNFSLQKLPASLPLTSAPRLVLPKLHGICC